MTSRYRINVGGVWMDTLDDNLLILDIAYAQPERSITKQTTANLDGYSISRTFVERQTVTVTFELHIYNTAKRNEACQKVNAWAQAGGVLRTNDRSGQRLMNVMCEQYADINSAKNWTDPLTLVFTTTYNPYWRSNDAISKTLTGKSARGTLKLDGNVDSALVTVAVTAIDAITSLQLVCGSSILKLKNISIPAGQSVTVSYQLDRYLRIYGNGRSIMANLDPTSSDNLIATCGANNAISVTANGRVSAVFTARGCWL